MTTIYPRDGGAASKIGSKVMQEHNTTSRIKSLNSLFKITILMMNPVCN